ncbi:preprotein translocase subunit SecA [Clostridiaceae bacterium WCA-383-APC-5B]|uniref:Protein translocase subunit SecA n=1 Tax=Inconstantimicrobium porci TaxID=2652291 RepID=A0A7X2MY36_9CLOT|nr:preprotein translocase subunit SecA [Inconstantimicrobium porci]MSR91194.1 preprotein translocase subunit SecA [Inconstantimicrobium porci]
MAFIDKIMSKVNSSEVKKLSKTADKVIALQSKYEAMSDEEIRKCSKDLKERVQNGESLDNVLVEAFAIAREADARILKKRPFKVQIMGGIVLHQGRIAEMKTGEGKTLVATLPAYLNALSGNGVHVITVNDYLAKVGAEEMSKVYEFLGLTTGVILPDMSNEDKKDAYNCDITYGINSEFGFDYLRDNMVKSYDEKVQRGFNFCIVDEVDSILIDEARTPLIVSAKGKKASELYKIADYFVKSLDEDVDYEVDHKTKTVILTEEGVSKAEKYYNVENFSDLENFAIKHHTYQALRANYIMTKEVDYIVSDNEVLIVDEFTGRVMDGRRFSDGLHEAIEAKEGLQQKEESRTMASITYQNFFKMYKKLSGMTGTAKTEEYEFNEIFNLDVVVIPTNKPIARVDNKDVLYATEYDKFKAVVEEIKKTHESGQPVLVGTTSIDKSELLSFMLKRAGIHHTVLNAKYHEKEAKIVAKAGQKGAVTIATNMAGRGTDILLGEGVTELGGLKVIGTERHDSQRIDNQLRGRSGRQGDVGESIFYLSLEDDLLKNHMSESDKNYFEKKKKNFEDGKPIILPNVQKAINHAQKAVESDNFETRKNLIKYDNVTSKQMEVLYEQRDLVLKSDNLKDKILSMADDVIIDNTAKEQKDTISALNGIFDMEYDKDPEDSMTTICKWYKEKFKENVDKKEEEMPERFNEIIRTALITIIDDVWVDHLQSIEHLKQYIVLKQYKQMDPAQAFMIEGADMFKESMLNIKKDIVMFVSSMKL